MRAAPGKPIEAAYSTRPATVRAGAGAFYTRGVGFVACVCTFARAASGHPQALGPAQEPVLRGAIWSQGTPDGLSL